MSDESETPPFESIAKLDKLVHEPARLSILTALSACERATFTFLRRLTGLTKGNLSSHLSKLEEAGLVDVEKTFEEKSPVTYASLSGDGRRAVARHWEHLHELRDQARSFGEEESDGNEDA